MLPSRYNSAAHHCLNSTRPTNQQEAEKGPFSSRSHRLLNDQPRLTFSLSARVFTHFHDGEIYLAKEREKKYLPYIRFHLHFFTSYFHDRPFIPWPFFFFPLHPKLALEFRHWPVQCLTEERSDTKRRGQKGKKKKLSRELGEDHTCCCAKKKKRKERVAYLLLYVDSLLFLP